MDTARQRHPHPCCYTMLSHSQHTTVRESQPTTQTLYLYMTCHTSTATPEPSPTSPEPHLRSMHACIASTPLPMHYASPAPFLSALLPPSPPSTHPMYTPTHTRTHAHRPGQGSGAHTCGPVCRVDLHPGHPAVHHHDCDGTACHGPGQVQVCVRGW